MGKYIKKFSTHTQYGTYINSQDKILPNVSLCEQEEELHYNKKPHDYSQDYLTLECVTAGDLVLMATDSSAIKTISYSIDEGNTWNNCTSKVQPTTMTTLNIGDKVLLKGYNSRYTSERSYIYNTMLIFQGTAKVYGNIMSLVYGDNFIGKNSFSNDYVFSNFFSGGIVSVENLILPATSLTEGCYLGLFHNLNITTAPKLPATTLADRCYEEMFYSCNNLTTAPELPATTLTDQCYSWMFARCTSLTTAPELPAETLTTYCYSNMFQNCTSLTTAPELSATTLANGCYSNMFESCTNLITAPELPATILTNRCYYEMFKDCTNLNYIKAMFTTEPSTTYTSNWVNGVSATGTFVKNSAAQWDVSSVNGVPSGWTVQTASN